MSASTPQIAQWTKDGYVIDCDKGRLKAAWVQSMLARSYWAADVPLKTVEAAIKGSLCFGLYDEKTDQQIGFCRVISDYATFAWISDVFVDEAYQGRGLGGWLITCLRAHPDLQGLRRWLVATRDAHGLYQKFGFEPADPGRLMTIHDPDFYRKP